LPEWIPTCDDDLAGESRARKTLSDRRAIDAGSEIVIEKDVRRLRTID